MRICRCALVLLLASGMIYSVNAQSMTEEGASSYTHRYARPGRATMTIYVWGQVSTPGIWNVEEGVNLVELLSATGVGGVGVESSQTRQNVVLHLYREQDGDRVQVYERQLTEIMAEGAQPPVLQENDVLMVETQQKQKFTVRTVAQYVGTVSSLTLLVLRLFRWR